jgi:hypothetical protein
MSWYGTSLPTLILRSDMQLCDSMRRCFKLISIQKIGKCVNLGVHVRTVTYQT